MREACLPILHLSRTCREASFLLSRICQCPGRSFLYVSTTIHDEDVQCAWTMYPLYTVKFDIAGGRWTGNERDGASLLDRFLQACDGFWNEIHNLIFIHHTEMVV